MNIENYDEIPEIREYDFIYGNMAANVNGITPMTHDPPKKQLASKTNAGDKYLQEKMIGCIFYQKNIDS